MKTATKQQQVIDWRRVKPTFGGLGCLFAATMLAACNGHCPPPQRQEIVKAINAERSQPAATPATTDELVIYLDTSGSMKGYVSAAGQSVFSRTLRTLREFSTTLAKPVEVHLRTVESQVGPPQSNAALVRASTDQTLYRGTQTNLVGAIETFSQPLFVQPASAPPPGQPQAAAPPVAVPRFHVL